MSEAPSRNERRGSTPCVIGIRDIPKATRGAWHIKPQSARSPRRIGSRVKRSPRGMCAGTPASSRDCMPRARDCGPAGRYSAGGAPARPRRRRSPRFFTHPQYASMYHALPLVEIAVGQ